MYCVLSFGGFHEDKAFYLVLGYVIGKPVALIQIPNQRMFGPKAAAKYLGCHEDTLKKIPITDLPVQKFNGRRAYFLEDLNAFVESLPKWGENGAGENPLPFPTTKKKGA